MDCVLNLVNYFVRGFYLHGPTLLGGHEGQSTIDICAGIMGTTASFLDTREGHVVCESRVEGRIRLYVVGSIAVFCIFLVISIGFFIWWAYLWHRETMRGIAVLERRRSIAEKSRNTKNMREENVVFIAEVVLVLGADLSDGDSMVRIRSALACMKVPPSPSEIDTTPRDATPCDETRLSCYNNTCDPDSDSNCDVGTDSISPNSMRLLLHDSPSSKSESNSRSRSPASLLLRGDRFFMTETLPIPNLRMSSPIIYRNPRLLTEGKKSE